MISDGNPILLYRRKSWFLIGWGGFIASNLWLALSSELTVNLVIYGMFIVTCFYLLADVCTDTMTVERSKYEDYTDKGSLQTSAYTIRSFGKKIELFFVCFDSLCVKHVYIFFSVF